MAFGCALPTVRVPCHARPLGYAAAILIGSAAGMLMLGLLKEKKA